MTLLDREELRIRWRQGLLGTPAGRAWLIAHAKEKEKHLGPHRQAEFDAWSIR